MPWWVVSLISAVVGMLILVLGMYLPLWGQITLLVGVVIFVFVMTRNRLYYYRRTATALLGGLCFLKALPHIELHLQFEQSVLARFLLEHTGNWDIVVIGSIVVVLLLLDYKRTSGAAQKLLESSATEFQGISKADKTKILLQKMQGSSKTFFVDTSKLNNDQAADIALQQIRNESNRQLAVLGVITVAILAVCIAVVLVFPRTVSGGQFLLPKVGDQPPWATKDQNESYTIHVRWENGQIGDADLYWELLPSSPDPNTSTFDRNRAVRLPRDRQFRDFSPPVTMPSDPYWRFVLESRGSILQRGPAEKLKIVVGSDE